MNSKKGFTLIELLVVIAIIGILSSVVLASLNSARVKGRIAAAQSSMKSVQAAAIMCGDSNSTLNTPDVTGTTLVCPAIASTFYPKLPGVWTYANGTGCTFSGVADAFVVCASGDGKVIKCDQNSCTVL